jgi:ComF family protein
MIELITFPINSLLFPRVCTSCRTNQVQGSREYACPDCWNQTQLISGTEALCEKCGLILGPNRRSNSVNCWQCDGHHYDQARSVGVYSHGLSAEVIALKSAPRMSRKVRELITEHWSSYGLEDFDVIIPVPLSRRRRHERGHNQAEVIAELLSKITGVGIDAHSIQRKHHSPLHRIGMDRKARDLSVTNAFEVVRPSLIEGKTILLVDDVYTTGATVSYCAKELKKAGASKVSVFTLARAVLQI